ncbi:MAG: SDR family NAD(P)-dependent oxidoreductase [Isosphaeraceae bacterium]
MVEAPEPLQSAARPVVLITGASAGLGAALACELARGRRAPAIVLAARRLDRLERLAGELRKIDPTIIVATVAVDLADPEGPGRLAREVVDRFGGVDVLINNAGLGLPTQFVDADPALIVRQVAVNFTAPLLLTRHCLPSLVERRGQIINIGSAITCVANSALGAYGATKAGLAYWNDALRRELAGTGVRVCLVEPGPIRTEFMDAIESMVTDGGRTDPILDNAAPWMTAEVWDVSRRVVGLLDRPRRRISMLRRLVWPFRLLGIIARLCPPLGDRVVATLSRRPLSSTATAKDAS